MSDTGGGGGGGRESRAVEFAREFLPGLMSSPPGGGAGGGWLGRRVGVPAALPPPDCGCCGYNYENKWN